MKTFFIVENIGDTNGRRYLTANKRKGRGDQEKT